MAASPESPSTLELTISIPGFSLPSSRPPYGDHAEEGCSVRDLDINLKPSGRDGGVYDDWMMGAANIKDEGESVNGNGAGRFTNPRKKLRLTKEQSHLLEESFKRNNTLNPKEKQELAVQLKLRPRQVEVWFQNRRARSKMKQTEMECEHLKRWFSSLREQNRLLKKELEELRAIKVSHPASTLTMCPRCERVSKTSADTAGPRPEEASQTHS